MGRRRSSPVNAMVGWIRRLSMKAKIALGVLVGILLMVALYSVGDYYYYFIIVSEGIHALGILVLIYKLTTKKSCSGLSLKTQEVTAIFVAVRMYCGFNFQPDIPTLIQVVAFCATIWVIYMMRFKLNSTYNKELDNMPLYYVIIPPAVLAVAVHPLTGHYSITMILWSFCVYLEAISVLPQLRLMQNAKMVEPFTAHYVFALGTSRFVGCAHWIIMIIHTRGAYLHFWGYGTIWMSMNLLAEIVQTFILADFCYYYVKRVMAGNLRMLPLPV